jgi:hypothetical protein
MKKGDRVKAKGTYWRILEEFNDAFLVISVEGFKLDKIPRLCVVK